MKKIITGLVLLFSITVFSQNSFLQNGNGVTADRAKEITLKYNQELVMDTNQRLIFEKKVEEFIISSDKVKEDYKGRDMLDKLFVLRQKEIAEMGDILTRIQLERYKEVRQRIQPLATVKSK